MADTIFHLPTTSEEFVRLAKEGRFAKNVLAETLDVKSRRMYLKACAALERGYTEACDAANDPCLESGCAMDHEHDEVCLQPLLRAEVEYQKACAAEWIKLFRSPENRIAGWRTA